ncbi:MAG TPA: pyridoxal phosphate-dependent aminotransferase [Petrotogaceae bacterium]|nr:pyridoxal phosphate-dependent aminotransferase [Petrotogaceae bacterium]
MNFSKRASQMQASPIRKLIPFSDEAKSKGKKVYHLNIGQPDLPTPQQFYDAVKKFTPKVLAYSHSAGLMELRQAFSQYYKKWNMDFSAEEIIVTNGGSEAIVFALSVVADPGDEILTIEPFYANYRGFCEMLNIKITAARSKAEDGYALPSKHEIESKITSKTRAILFSNPSNPTGAVYTRHEVQTLVEIAKEHDLYLISDEVYKEFTFDGLKHVSAMEFGEYDRTIIVDSISKRFSACGARIGVLATKNKEVFAQSMKFAQSRLCAPVLEQYGTIGVLNDLGSSYLEEMRQEYQRRRDAVFCELQKIEGAKMKMPKGSFYVSVELPVDDSEKFIKWMLSDFAIENETVMVAPLSGFYTNDEFGKKEIRIAYVLEPDKLKKACYILGEGVKQYRKTFM